VDTELSPERRRYWAARSGLHVALSNIRALRADVIDTLWVSDEARQDVDILEACVLTAIGGLEEVYDEVYP